MSLVGTLFYLPFALTTKINVYLCICTVLYLNKDLDYTNIKPRFHALSIEKLHVISFNEQYGF